MIDVAGGLASGELDWHWGRVCLHPNYRGGYYGEQLSLAGNLVFLIIFASLFQPQIFLAIKHRTTSTGILFVLTITLEILGYLGRLYYTLDARSNWAAYLGFISLYLAPVFLAAGIFSTLSRIIVVFDGDADPKEKAARWSPRRYAMIALGLTGFTLVIEMLGLALLLAMVLAWSRDRYQAYFVGYYLQIIGVSILLATIVFFAANAAVLGSKWLKKSRQGTLSLQNSTIYRSRKFKFSISALILATICLTIQTSFKIAAAASFWTGFRDIHEEGMLFGLDGAMMTIACVAVTLAHPGLGLASVWKEGSIRSRKKKQETPDEGMVVESVGTSFESTRKLED